MICQSKHAVGSVPAKHQGSWAPSAQAEKVRSSTKVAACFVQRRPAVQPLVSEVRRLEPAWVVGFPTSQPPQPTCAHAYTRAYARNGSGNGFPLSGETSKQVRKVRRLGRTSIHQGSSRPTSSPTFLGLDELGEESA
jgi:hypothetical protein